MTPEPEFSRLVEAADLDDRETVFDIDAGANERDALARRFDLTALESLTARVRLTSVEGTPFVRLRAEMRADVVQSCVVTLQPVRTHIEATFERTFGPPGGEGMPKHLDLSPESDVPPEPLTGGSVDIGKAVTEQLALELDPFPRAPGARFEGFVGSRRESCDDEGGPFAGLARLKGAGRDSE